MNLGMDEGRNIRDRVLTYPWKTKEREKNNKNGVKREEILVGPGQARTSSRRVYRKQIDYHSLFRLRLWGSERLYDDQAFDFSVIDERKKTLRPHRDTKQIFRGESPRRRIDEKGKWKGRRKIRKRGKGEIRGWESGARSVKV